MLAVYADRLYRSASWWEAYEVLGAVPDELLSPFAAPVAKDPLRATRSIAAVLANAAASGPRATGFVAVQLASGAPPLVSLCFEATERISDPESAALARRLLLDLAQLASHLPYETWFAVLDLAVSCCTHTPDVQVLAAAASLETNAPGAGPDHADNCQLRAEVLQLLFIHQGRFADLEHSLTLGDEALGHTSEGSDSWATSLLKQASRLHLRAEVLGDRADTDRSIKLCERALDVLPADSIDRPSALVLTAVGYLLRFQLGSDPANLDRSIELSEQAIQSSWAGPDVLVVTVYALALQYRYARDGDVADLENAIQMSDGTGSGSLPHDLAAAAAQSVRYGLRFERLGNPNDLERAMQVGSAALAGLPTSSPACRELLAAQGRHYRLRFELSGRVADLDEAFDMTKRAIRLAPEGSPALTALRVSTIEMHRLRYERQRTKADLDDPIAITEQLLSANTPDEVRKVLLSNQAGRYLERFQRFGEEADLRFALNCCEQADLLMGRDEPARWRLLANHAAAFEARYRLEGNPSDLNNAISIGEVGLEPDHLGAAEHLTLTGAQSVRFRLLFEVSGDRTHLKRSIDLCQLAVSMSAADSIERARLQIALGTALLLRAGHGSPSDDIDEAIRLLQHVVKNPSAGPEERAATLTNLSNALLRRHELSDRSDDLDDALRAVSDAIAMTPAGSWSRPVRLIAASNAYMRRFFRDLTTEDFEQALQAGMEALQVLPKSSPHWTGALANVALLQLARADIVGAAGAGAQARVLLEQWCELVAAGSGTFEGVFGHVRVWRDLLSEHASEGLVGWGLVARVGEVVLGRAAATSEGGSASVEVLWEIRLRLEGVVSLAAFAAVRAGDPQRAVTMLESGSATIARVQASQIDWGLACEAVPGVAGEALELQARVVHATDVGDLERVAELMPLYLERVRELRRVLRIPDPQPASLDQLAVSGLSHVWVIATPHGGLAVRHHQGEVHSIELPDLTTDAVTQWHAMLHPGTSGGDGAGVREPGAVVRGPQGGCAPGWVAVAAVLDAMDEVLAPAAGWLGAEGWLVPAGVCRLLPWQARYPGRRLHITATHTLADHQPVDGPVVVFANPTGDLPGARLEAETLGGEGHVVREGPDATLEELATMPLPAAVLHVAAHGTSDPSIRFHGGDGEGVPLGLGNIDQFRHLWPQVGHLVLNCCVSASQVNDHHDETMSLATIALTHGTRRATVALWPLDDGFAAQWGLHCHGLMPLPDHLPTVAAYLTYG